MKLRPSPRGYTLLEVLVVIAIMGVLTALLLAAVQRTRERANQLACQNKLHQIALALQNYHDVHGSLPPGVSYRNGTDPYPFMSWNTRLLPFLEQDALWNLAVAAFAKDPRFLNNPPHVDLVTFVPLFACPSDPLNFQTRTLAGTFRVAFTDYLGVEGTNQFSKDGLLYLDSQVRLTGISDGTSNTLMVGERPPSADGVLGWWYAGEGQSQDGSADMVLGVREMNASVYAPNCPAGPYGYGPGNGQNQCDVFHFWSFHPGGAHFLFADGSVHFLPYAAASVLPALATRAGGEPESWTE